MKRRSPFTLVALLVVAVLVGLGGWWVVRGRGGSTATDEHASGSAGTAGTRAGGASAGARSSPGVPASVSGRVTQRAGGAGIAGARIALSRAELGAGIFEAGSTPTIQAVADAQGAWTASTVPPGVYVVTAAAKGFVPGSRDKVLVGSGDRTTGIDLALDAGGILVTGTVSDVGGGPIAGAEVAMTKARMTLHGGAEMIAIAGDDGRYEITLEDASYGAAASHADYTTETRFVELGGKPMTIDFTLTPGGTIRGQVVTRDGKPLPAAVVQVGRGFGDGSSTRADDQGKFTLKSLAAGAISLSAMGRGYASSAPTVVELGIGEQIDDITIIVDRAYTISGTVVERGTTKGIAGVRLGVFSLGQGETAIALDPSASDGAFEIYGVRPASYMMFAIGDEVMPEVGKQIEVVDKDVTGVIVDMAGGVTVTGRVEPPRVATIGISPTMVGFANIFEAVKTAMVRAESDETGAFTLRHVPPGSLNVTATTTDGHAGKVLVLVDTVDKVGVVVKLEKRSSIAGRVVDARGTPLAGVRVTGSPVREKDSDDTSFNISFEGKGDSAVTGVDGAFLLVGLEEGKIGVRVYDEGGPLRWADAAHRDKPREEIVFELAKGAERTGVTLTVETRDGVIRGNVIGADKKPAADIWVTATLVPDDLPKTKTKDKDDDDDEEMMDGRHDTAQSKPVLTGADGTFVIDRLRKGSYLVVAEAARGTSRTQKTGVKTGDSVTLTLAPLGTLTGRVTVGTTAVAAYDLSCKVAGGDRDFDRRITDAGGAYKLERLPPAEYTCSAVADAGRATAKITVPPGEAKLDLVLAPFATITGTIVSALTGQPVAGVKVVAGGDEGDFDGKAIAELLTGGGPTSDAAGTFTVARVPPGKGELVVMPKDGGFQQLAKRKYTATSGQHIELGTIKIVPPRTGEAGTLGMGTDITDGALVVSSVKSGGPAEAAGVRIGDKLVTINGTAVAELTPELSQTLISSGTVGVGESFLLGVDRAGTAAQIKVVAVAW
ncbi:MAG: carboxypeptidase regulatory-like domain-containing protein [Deltaproteobacteria bacterium]|nr:carboxypeptidase regulatory-like domain-containing protein [Deltaproteobacteria bacterium]